MSTSRMIVVGAGPSGLGAAFRLQQAGWRVRLLESGTKVGGRFTTLERDGFLMDQGAQVIPSAHTTLLSIIGAAGMQDELVPGGSVIAFARDDALHTIDTNHLIRDGLRLGQVSTRSKLRLARLALDVARAYRTLGFTDLDKVASLDDESAGAYARRVLGQENFDFVIDTAMRGMLAIPADDLSKVDLFYGLSKFIGVTFHALRGGNGTYGERLAARFDTEVQARVTDVVEHDDHVTVTWTSADGSVRTEDAEGCVLAVPSTVAAELHPGLDEWRRDFLRNVSYSESVSISAALDAPPGGLDTSLIFVPRKVHPGLIGMVLDHNKAPGRVPTGRGLVSGYAEQHWARELIDQDDDVVEKEMLESFDRLIPGLSDTVRFTVVGRWRPTAMYAHPGYYRELQQFVARSDADRRIQLAGDYAMTSNVDTATRNGVEAAARLVAVAR